MKMKLKSLIVFLSVAVLMLSVGIVSALAAGPNMAADKGIINVYLIAGQSNAVGYGEGAPTSGEKEFTEGFDNAIYYGLQENNDVSDFVPVKVGLGKNKSCVGAEIGIASALADSNEMNAVIKCAWGATFLYPALNEDVSKSNGTWTSPSYIEMANNNADVADVDLTKKIASGRFAGGTIAGNMYSQFMTKITEGLQLLKEDGYTPVIKGIWWMQGEAEVYNETMSKEYATLLNYLISDMRGDISDITGEDYSDLPFVMGKVVRNGGIDYTTGKIYSQPKYIENVRSAMQGAADSGKNVFAVDCKNLAQLDGWHFSSDAQKWLGEQYVNAVRTAEGNTVTDYGTITPTYADPAKYPFALFAGDEFVSAYETLADACQKANTYNVETQILLRSNAVVSSAIGEFKSINLDLAGNTLTANGTVFTKGFISIKNGKIALGSADFIKMTSSTSATAKVVIENCTFDFTKASNGVCVVNTADTNNVYDVDVTINGGEIVTSDFSKNSFYKLGDGDSIKFNKYEGQYIKMTLPSSAAAPTGNYPTDNGNAKFVVIKTQNDKVTYTLSVLEIPGYGTISSAYESVEEYPFAVFHNGQFVSAHSSWNSAGQAARNITTGSANKNKVAYVLLRRDYDVTERFYNTSQIGGTLVLDLNGYTMTAANTIFDGTAKTVGGVGTEICDTYVRVINGTMLAKNKPIITFDRNTEVYTSEKTFYFTFENVTIGLAENYTEGVNVVCATGANTASAKAYAEITLNDCVFDLTALGKASDITLFAPKDNNNEIDVEITVNGGEMLANELDRVVWQNVDSGKDKVVFSKGSDGKYLKLSHEMLNADYPHYKVALYNADNKELTFTKVSMNDGNAVYELKESEETKYGLLPDRYTIKDDYPFVVFDEKGAFFGAYSAWIGNNGTGGALGSVKAYINNAWDGSSYGSNPKEAFILVRRDYTMDSSKDIKYDNLAQTQGTINIDLDGHVLSTGSVKYALFPAYSKTFSGATGEIAFPTNLIISNGTLKHSQNGVVEMNTWDSSHDGQVANKEFNFTFNNVTFGFANGANASTLVTKVLSPNTSGGAPTVAAPFNLTYNDCTFDVKTTASSQSSVTLFSTTNSQYVKVKHTVNGGVVKTGSSTINFFTTDGSYGSSVTFEKGSNGKYLSYIAPSSLTVTTDMFPSSDCSLSFAKTGTSGSDNEYVLEVVEGTASIETKYGKIPADKVANGQVFAVFAKKASDANYTFINTFGSMRGGALNNSRDLVKHNSGTYAGGTVVIYMLKDYNYSTGGNGSENFNRGFQIDGTMLIDLGGYKLTIDDKPRLIGFETGSDDLKGTDCSYNTVLKFVNGAIKADNPVVEVFGGSSSYTGAKTLEVSFEDIAFEPKSGTDTRGIIKAREAFKSGQSVNMKLNYTDCTFNYASSGVVLYDDTATGDNSNPVVTDVKVNGGNVKVADLSKFTVRTDTAHDSVTFGKNASGERTTFTLNYTDSAPTTTFTTDAGTMSLATESLTHQMITGKTALTYSLSNVKRGDYGYVPLSKSGNTFAVFYGNHHTGSYDKLNDGSSGAVNAAKVLMFGGNSAGALKGKSMTIYMSKDYELSATSYTNYAQVDGTIVLDLGGHTITQPEGKYLFNLTSKAVDGKLTTTTTKVKNGKILTTSDAIMKVQSASNFAYTGTKNFSFTYENVTFDKHSSYATYYAPHVQVVNYSDNSGTKNVALNVTYNGCTINSKDSILFSCATSNYVDVNATINGGSFTGHTMSDKGLMNGSDADDKVTIGKYNGNRTTFKLDYAESAPTVVFTTDEGKMGLASEPLTKDIISAKSPISYTLSNVKAGDNGYIPSSKAGNTFYVFYNNLYIGTYSHLNANGGAMDTVKGFLFGGKNPGVLYEKTLTIYANEDYDDTVESGRFANYAQIGGHVVLDLGGHTIKQTSGNYCFNLTSKAVDGKLPITSATVKNGTILTTLEPIMKIQSPNNFSYDGIKTYNFTYENVTFDRAPEVTNYTAIANVATFVDNDGTKNVDFNATFNNCTFKSANSVLFDFALCNYVDADITINGGSLIAQSMGDTGVMKTSDSDDKFAFGQYEGEYMTLQLAKNVSTPKVTFNNGALEFTLVSETADATNFKLISTDKTAALKSYSPKMSLTLDSTLKMNVYVPQELTKTFEIDGVSDKYDTKVTLTDGKVYYRKTVELTSSDAIRNVILKVTVSTGEKDIKGTFTFSVPKYANRIFESGNGVEKQLIRDVLSYVRASYKYFKADDTQSIAQVDALIGTYYEQLTPFTPETVTVNPTSFKAATFQLAGTPAFRFYLNTGDSASKYSFKIDGKEVEAVSGSDSNGEYLQIAVYAYQMCEKITYFAEGTEVGSYHISSYYDWAKTQNNTSVVNVVERFWAYCQSARDYKNSVEIQIKYVDEAGKELAKSYTNSYKLGEEFTVLSPAVEGYYTRDVYKTAFATGNEVIEVVYKKIPSNIDASIASAKLPNVAAWGDSITAGGSAYNTTVANQYSIDLTALGSSAGGGTYAEILQNLIAGRVYSGIDVANCGVGGESTATITARANAENYYLYLGTGVTIGSAPIVIDLQQEYPDTLNPGRLGVLRTSLKDSLSHVTIVDKNGTSITGVITCTVTPSIPSSESLKDVWNCDVKYLVYTFTRTDGKTNDVKLSADARVIMNAAVDYDGRTCIIFMGENNGYSNKGTVDRDVKILIAQQKEILKACGNPEEFLIISSTSGSNETRKGITEALTKEWGDRYINMGNELNSSRKSYEFVGYSEADIVSVQENIVNGTVTPLLLNDGCHPHAVGYTVVGNVIFERMYKLGMFDELFDYYDSLQK